MAIVLNSAGITANKYTGGATGSITVSHTVDGSSDALYVYIAFDDSTTHTFASVQYNSVAMTQIASTELGTGRSVYLYRLLAPATGTNNVFIDWDGNQNLVSYLFVDASGVDQTTPETSTGTDEGNGTSISISGLSSTTDDLVLGFGYLNNEAITDVTEGAGQTTEGSQGTNGVVWCSSKVGASPTQSLSWTVTSQAFGAIGVSVAAAATGPAIDSSDASVTIDGTVNYTVSNFGSTINEAEINDGTFALDATTANNTQATFPGYSHGLVSPAIGAGKTLQVGDGTDTATATIELQTESGTTENAVGTIAGGLTDKDWGFGLTGLGSGDQYVTRNADSSFVTHNNDGTSTVTGFGTTQVYSWDDADGTWTSIQITYTATAAGSFNDRLMSALSAYTGALPDRLFKYLRAQGYTGSLNDMAQEGGGWQQIYTDLGVI